jgi:NAD(P)-dependent dehydrogenase (short-subunit alcohol dehydrogenase family)
MPQGVAEWNFEDRVVVVTNAGSPRGVGQVRAFAAAGATVYACVGLDGDVAPDLSGGVQLSVDFDSEASVARLAERISTDCERLDVLVVNDLGGEDARLLGVSDLTWQHLIDASLTSAFLAAKHLTPMMVPARSGKVVFTTGPESSFDAPPRGHVSAVRHAIAGLAKVLAIELAEHQINVNVAAGGPGVDLADATAIVALTNQVLWLSSDAARFTTGSVVHAGPRLMQLSA